MFPIQRSQQFHLRKTVLQGTDNITVIQVVIGSLQRAHHPSFNLMIVKEVVACVFPFFFHTESQVAIEAVSLAEGGG